MLTEARRRLACAALGLCLAWLACVRPAQGQVLILESDAQTQALAEALRIQFSGRAQVQSVAAPPGELGSNARNSLEQREARVVLWIAQDDRPEPDGGDYLLSVARSLPDGPGIEVVRLHAQTGALGDRALALRVAELYPRSPAPLLVREGNRGDTRRDHPPARLQAAVFVQAQSTLTPAGPGAELGYRIALGSLRLVPKLSAWWLPASSMMQDERKLELGGLGCATSLELLRQLGWFDLGAAAALSWQAHRARAEGSNGAQGSVTEWVPAIVPQVVVALRFPETPLYAGVSGGVAWSLVQQHWWVDGQKLRSEARLGPSGRLMLGAIF